MAGDFARDVSLDKLNLDRLVRERAKILAHEMVMKKEAARRRRERKRREEAALAMRIGRIFLQHARKSGISKDYESEAVRMLENVFPAEA